MLEVQIKHPGPLTVAFKKMRGPYTQAGEAFGGLYAWVEHYGLKPVGMPQAIYITVPSVTPETEAEWEIWAPIAGGAGRTEADASGIGVKRIEPEVLATATHRGAYETLGEVHGQLQAWLTQQGYRAVGPPREVYYSGPEVAPEDTVTEIQVPVARRQQPT